MMSDRKNEVTFAMYIIQKICIECNICLFPKKLKDGQYAVITHDNVEDKDYCIIKKQGEENAV